jgi:hypothetical protein
MSGTILSGGITLSGILQISALIEGLKAQHATVTTAVNDFQTAREECATKIALITREDYDGILEQLPAVPRPRRLMRPTLPPVAPAPAPEPTPEAVPEPAPEPVYDIGEEAAE